MSAGRPDTSTEAGLWPAKKPLKWRKMARAILGSAEGNSMRLKAFKSRAWELAKQRGALDKAAALQEMLGILAVSKQFELGPQRISLAA